MKQKRGGYKQVLLDSINITFRLTLFSHSTRREEDYLAEIIMVNKER